MAYAWALQYWVEETILLAPSEPCLLVMSARELRWHVRKYITFSEQEVFKGLGKDEPETKDRDTKAPPVDFTASPAMADANDTQSGPVETPLVDDITVPVSESNAEIQKDNPTTQGASPVESDDAVAPTAMLVDKLASPSTPASHTVRERQKYPQGIKVHSSRKATAVGSTPFQSEKPGQCHNHSSKQCKSVWHLLDKEWQSTRDVFRSALSKSSPELAPWGKEGKGAGPKECPWGSGRLLSAWQLEEPQWDRPLLPWMFLRPVWPPYCWWSPQ